MGDYNILEQLCDQNNDVPTFNCHKKCYTLKGDLDIFMKK